MSTNKSVERFFVAGMALEPIHVGTGGARLGRVDLSIVRDPVTQVPKIPGSSLAGVYRTYVAMAMHESYQREGEPYFPNCAGLGQEGEGKGHCGKADCPVCVVFGFARAQGRSGGFAGLAAFSDAHILLFPVPTREGPMWITCPEALRLAGIDVPEDIELDNAFYRIGQKSQNSPQPESPQHINLGWLLLPVEKIEELNDDFGEDLRKSLEKGKFSDSDSEYIWKVPPYILNRVGLVSDKLFSHIVNSNLEVRTSVSIDPATGAAEEGALFTYEAIPRSTILVWQVICKDPKQFKVGREEIKALVNGDPSGKEKRVDCPKKVFEVVKTAHNFFELLGIGGMGTRGMGRLRVLEEKDSKNNAQAQASGGQK